MILLSPGAYIETPNGSPQGFLIKFQDSQIFSNPIASSNSPVCIGKTLELKASAEQIILGLDQTDLHQQNKTQLL